MTREVNPEWVEIALERKSRLEAEEGPAQSWCARLESCSPRPGHGCWDLDRSWGGAVRAAG